MASVMTKDSTRAGGVPRSPLPATVRVRIPSACALLDRLPLRTGADDRRAPPKPVLEHFAPAAAAMRLDEKTVSPDLELDCAPVFHLAMDLARAVQQPVESRVSGQVTFEMGAQFDHGLARLRLRPTRRVSSSSALAATTVTSARRLAKWRRCAAQELDSFTTDFKREVTLARLRLRPTRRVSSPSALAATTVTSARRLAILSRALLWQNRAGTGENQGLAAQENAVANRHPVAFVPHSSPARFCFASAHECPFR